MAPTHWTFTVILGLFAVHALLAYRAYRLRGRGADALADGSAGTETRVDVDAGVVTCPDCETENNLGYRFCKQCVGELPRGMDFESPADAPMGRFIR